MPDVVIVGGGIAGLATAYYLGLAGIKSTVVERDSIGSHASGFAFGELTPSRGTGIPGPLQPLAQEGMRLHRDLSPALKELSGIDAGFRVQPTLVLMFSQEDVENERASLPIEQEHAGYGVRWVEAAEARRLEPRIAEHLLAAVCLEGTGEVDPYRLTLALAGGAERLGATIRTGRVTGLQRQGDRVTGVTLESGRIACDCVVLATGPWAVEASEWTGLNLPVRPVKGQILRLRADGPPIEYRLTWGHSYCRTKPDGLVWAGTTMEEAGFDEATTPEARQFITEGLVAGVPSLIDAQLVEHTACLRPVAPDWLPILGAVPGWDGLYVATGGGRKGILLGPPMGKAVSDLITGRETDLPIGAFAVDRFAAAPSTPGGG